MIRITSFLLVFLTGAMSTEKKCPDCDHVNEYNSSWTLRVTVHVAMPPFQSPSSDFVDSPYFILSERDFHHMTSSEGNYSEYEGMVRVGLVKAMLPTFADALREACCDDPECPETMIKGSAAFDPMMTALAHGEVRAHQVVALYTDVDPSNSQTGLDDSIELRALDSVAIERADWYEDGMGVPKELRLVIPRAAVEGILRSKNPSLLQVQMTRVGESRWTTRMMRNSLLSFMGERLAMSCGHDAGEAIRAIEERIYNASNSKDDYKRRAKHELDNPDLQVKCTETHEQDIPDLDGKAAVTSSNTSSKKLKKLRDSFLEHLAATYPRLPAATRTTIEQRAYATGSANMESYLAACKAIEEKVKVIYERKVAEATAAATPTVPSAAPPAPTSTSAPVTVKPEPMDLDRVKVEPGGIEATSPAARLVKSEADGGSVSAPTVKVEIMTDTKGNVTTSDEIKQELK